jgi:hypothetical protein
MLQMLLFAANPILRSCCPAIASAARQLPLALFSSQAPEESALKKTLLKYRASASKSRDKAVKQAYMQLANDIQAKLNSEASAAMDSSRSQAALKSTASVEVTLSAPAKSGAAALKFRLPSSFKPAVADKSKHSSR